MTDSDERLIVVSEQAAGEGSTALQRARATAALRLSLAADGDPVSAKVLGKVLRPGHRKLKKNLKRG